MVYCYKRPESCLGDDKCEEGYFGKMCEECDVI